MTVTLQKGPSVIFPPQKTATFLPPSNIGDTFVIKDAGRIFGSIVIYNICYILFDSNKKKPRIFTDQHIHSSY